MSIIFLLIAAVFLRVISNPVSNVFQKQLTKDGLQPLFVNLMSYGLLAIFSLPLLLHYRLNDLPQSFWYNAILGGLFGALGNGFIVKALESGELSVLGPINAYKSVVGLIFAFILIGEIPNGYGVLGIGLIIFGSYYVIRRPAEHFQWQVLNLKAVKFRIAGLIFTGVEAVFDKKVIQLTDQILAFVAWSIIGAVFSYIFLFINRISISNEFKKMDRQKVIKQTLLMLSIAVMIISTNYCFSKMPVGESLALFQLSILVSVFFGYQFFGETNILQKIIGSLIMIGGSLLIIFFHNLPK